MLSKLSQNQTDLFAQRRKISLKIGKLKMYPISLKIIREYRFYV